MTSKPCRADPAPGRPGRTRPGTVVILTVLVLAVPALAVPAAAQDDAPGDVEQVRLTVTDLTGVLGPGSLPPSPDAPEDREPASDELSVRMLVENASDDPIDSLSVIVEVYPAVDSRSELRRAFDGDFAAPPAHIHTHAMAEGGDLRPGEIRGLSDRFHPDEVEWADEPGGVHPVRLAVTRGVEVLDEAVTAVVWLDELPSAPTLTTVVWPIDAPPWRTTRGAYHYDADAELDPGGRLDVLLRTVEDVRSEPVVLAPAAHLLEDLSDRSDGFTALERAPNGELVSRRVPASAGAPAVATDTLARLRELAATLTAAPISGPYADADLPGLLAGDPSLRELAAVTAAEGRRRVQLQLGVEADASTNLIRHPITDDAVELLPGDQLLLSSDVVAPPEGGHTDLPTVGQLQAPSGRLLGTLLADADLESSLGSTDHPAGPVLAAQRPIAESAAAHLVGDDRALVILPPATWDPSPEVADRLLDELTSASWLQLVSPSQMISQVPPGGSLELRSTPDGSTLSHGLADRISEVAGGLDAAAAALPDGSELAGGRTVDELEDTVLRATSTWYRGADEQEAEELLRDVERSVDATFGEIEVASGEITLTSDTGQIPVTLQRRRGGPIVVDVELDSPGTLRWPEGRRVGGVVLETDESWTVTFPTEALSTGAFPVSVRVTDPSGQRELASGTIAVRSTAISGPALGVISAIVLGLLIVGVLRRTPGGRSRHRPDHPPPPPPDTPSGPMLTVVDRTGADTDTDDADADDRP